MINRKKFLKTCKMRTDFDTAPTEKLMLDIRT